MLGLGLAMLGGVGLLHWLPMLPGGGWIALTLLGLPLLLRTLPARFRLHALAALAGFLWAEWHALGVMADRLEAPAQGVDVQLVGRVDSLPERGTGRTRFDLRVEAPAGLPARVRLSWYGAPPALAAGERWRLRARLRAPRGFANPGGFDYERSLLLEGIGATGYVRDDAANARLDAAVPFSLLRLRATVAGRLAAILGEAPAAGLILGLAVGDRGRIEVAQWQVLRRTGTAHLMAISGLHIGLVAGLCYWLGRRLGRWRRAQRATRHDLAGLSALLAACAYAALAGGSLPTQRALLMLSVVLLGLRLRRPVVAGHSLGLALLVVLVRDPLAPLALGFWLSFVAVACLSLALGGRLGAQPRWRTMLRSQCAVGLGLAPLAIGGFGQLSLIGPLANLWLIPLFGCVVVPLVLLGTAGLFVWEPLGAALLAGAAGALQISWPCVEALAAARWAAIVLDAPAGVLLALALAAALLMLPALQRLRGLALILLLPLVLWRPPAPAPGAFELTLLDVGQGLAAVVRTHRHTLIYDAGPAFRSGSDTGALVVLPFLQQRGWRTDLLIVSHDDNDHAGGAGSLLRETELGAYITAPAMTAAHPRRQACRRGMRWRWDGVEFAFLHPPPHAQWTGNDGSCVLMISAPGGRALLPGDIEAAAERTLIESADVQSDIVVVPHHGSRTSSTEAFVAATGARFALFATGYGNRWGFPRADVVERWRAHGAMTFDTGEDGALSVRIDSSGELSIEAFRTQSRRYWYR